jgi:hypothetical protein
MKFASVAESADATDLKSVTRKGVRVQFPPLAPVDSGSRNSEDFLPVPIERRKDFGTMAQ